MGQGKLDKASVKSIWHSPTSAWKGIDDILPTGGRYGFEVDHQHTHAQAGMLHFLKQADLEIKSLEKALPQDTSADTQKELSQARAVLDGEDRSIQAAEARVENNPRGTATKSATAQMLSQKQHQVFSPPLASFRRRPVACRW